MKSNQYENNELFFLSIEEELFSIHGVFKENGEYRRLPENVAKSISEGIYLRHTNTAGGRVRFRTNSKIIAIKAIMNHIYKMPHFTFCGSNGFDLYSNDIYSGTFIPDLNITNGYESSIQLSDCDIKDITINFPLYCNVMDLYIGIEKDAYIEKPKVYSHSKPIVFYGSSITQGGCASRPGNTYPSILSRNLDCDYINLGFSSSAKAEDEMVNYIKDLEMSVFVMDYDHNAPNVEYLEKTHEKMFRKIRDRNPNLPIIMMSRPKYYLNDDDKKRLEVVKKTYQNAILEGDTNVYFLDGKSLMRIAKDNGTVDNCHPNDLGFYSIANAIEEVFKVSGIVNKL